MDSHDFIEVSGLARLLYSDYPKVTRDRERERENIESSRNFADRYQENATYSAMAKYQTDQARKAYGEWDKVCEEYARSLWRLADLVAKRLPKVYEDLRLVQQFTKWHTEREFDWDAAEKELRRIEAAALQAADQAGGKPPEDQADEDQEDRLEWSKPVGYKVLRKTLGDISQKTLKARLVESSGSVVGKIRYKAPHAKARLIQVVVSDLPADEQARFRQTSRQAST